MTPEVVEKFVSLDQESLIVWNDEEGSVCTTIALVAAVEMCAVTAAGNYIPVNAITSIARADALDGLRTS